ncbi:NAD-dependent epimerase/dehydratase family protein [Sphingomonas sp. BT-65]|uniref:NAD-dependent epimerase/dehydratase family protein n=1 Tax=Sphingomonas sp. BT-65 TaxID=2989821 RepID=UPI0022355023|nr:NAD-dependent epimerase/dehydratase family protein [Sphingomonas sp. BT-65]MCW4461887.1 NAD-dependent epimerase/dehydratase family protein [Sphingomonas sp. BT-65]
MTGRILVTGGNGRLGREILSLLGPRGVAGVRRCNSANAEVTLTISDPLDLDPARLNGFDAIINCAGRVTGTREELDRVNVSYPLALARHAAVAGVRRFIQVSSFSVYGRTERIDADSPLSPESDYGLSKLASEQKLAALATDTFLVSSLRLPFMFSAAEPALLGRLVSGMLWLRVLPVPYGGVSRRSMITYAGAADALITLATMQDMPTGAIVAADPDPLELTAVADALGECLGRHIAVLPIPATLATLARPLAPTMIDRLLGSNILDRSINWLAGGTRFPAAAEVHLYLDRIRQKGNG